MIYVALPGAVSYAAALQHRLVFNIHFLSVTGNMFSDTVSHVVTFNSLYDIFTILIYMLYGVRYAYYYSRRSARSQHA